VCIATQKLMPRENSIIVKEKLNTSLFLAKEDLRGDVKISKYCKKDRAVLSIASE